MKVEQAMQLKDKDRVHVSYNGIKEYGTVRGLPGPTVNKTAQGTEFVYVCVYLPSQGHASVFGSHFLS